jgi:putative colanic acid biosynthesis UDP-glucose lipid carrier transferase
MAVVEIKRFVRSSKHISPKSKGVKSRPNRTIYLIGKRLFDIVVSTLIITLVLSWLIPILAMLIKLDSKGPVFFIQNRVGFLGCTFRCFKLRTMVVNEDADSKQALNNDPRITRLGSFLRVTSLDELPQFLNVLMGSMSIVGPRPFMLKDDQSFSIVVSNYPLRYCARPGITGMAQVKGYRGPTANFHSIFHRYQWDAFYIRNASPSLDFKIIRITIRQTIKSMFPFKIDTRGNNEYVPVNTRQMVLENAT